MSDIEHWIGVTMAAGYDEDDLRDAVELLRERRDFAEVVMVESAEAPTTRGVVEAERDRIVALIRREASETFYMKLDLELRELADRIAAGGQ